MLYYNSDKLSLAPVTHVVKVSDKPASASDISSASSLLEAFIKQEESKMLRFDTTQMLKELQNQQQQQITS